MKTNIYLYGLMIFLMAGIFSSTAIAQDEVKKEGWFYAVDNPYVEVSLRDSEFATGVLDALADAGTNWTSLWDGIESFEGDDRENACWLIVNMPHLDRLEMTKDTLIEHVTYAYRTRTDLQYSVPDDLFREYILTYRMGDEPVRPYRKLIWDEFSSLISDTPADTAKAINQWVFENMTTRERGFFGPRPDPWSVITARTGTEADIAGVAIAMCKTFGIPARRAMIGVLGEESGGKTWLEIYSDGAWLPLYPDSPDNFGNMAFLETDHPHNVTVVSAASAFTQAQVTSRYTDTGTVHFMFTQNGEPVDEFENFCVSVWNDGAWLPLDDLWYDPEDLGLNSDEETPGFTAVLGDGFYIAQVGVRNPRGDAYVQTMPVMVNAGDAIELEFNLDIPASESSELELVSRAVDPLPIITTNYADERQGPLIRLPADLLSSTTYNCLTIFDSTSEASIRMLPIISDWCNSHNSAFLGIGVGDLTECQNLWSANTDSTAFWTDRDGAIPTAIGLTPDEQGLYAMLPVVFLLTPTLDIIYLQYGLNLSVADGLSRAVELNP